MLPLLLNDPRMMTALLNEYYPIDESSSEASQDQTQRAQPKRRPKSIPRAKPKAKAGAGASSSSGYGRAGLRLNTNPSTPGATLEIPIRGQTTGEGTTPAADANPPPPPDPTGDFMRNLFSQLLADSLFAGSGDEVSESDIDEEN